MVEFNEKSIIETTAKQLVAMNGLGTSLGTTPQVENGITTPTSTSVHPQQQVKTPPPTEATPQQINVDVSNKQAKKKSYSMTTVVTEGANGQRHLTGRWTKDEHDLFLKGLDLYGRDWRKIAKTIKTRNFIQIRTHAQKYFKKLAKICQLQGEEVPEELTSTASDGKTWELDRRLRAKAAQVEACNLRLPSTNGLRPGRPKKEKHVKEEQSNPLLQFPVQEKQPVGLVMQAQPYLSGPPMNNVCYMPANTSAHQMYPTLFNSNVTTSQPMVSMYGQPAYVVGVPNAQIPVNTPPYYTPQYVVVQPQSMVPMHHIQT